MAPTSDDDAAHAEDEGEEEEAEEDDELSEPTPVKRPVAATAASRRRSPAATVAATVTLPVYIHTRYTEGAEGQYILDANKMSVVSCSKNNIRITSSSSWRSRKSSSPADSERRRPQELVCIR